MRHLLPLLAFLLWACADNTTPAPTEDSHSDGSQSPAEDSTTPDLGDGTAGPDAEPDTAGPDGEPDSSTDATDTAGPDGEPDTPGPDGEPDSSTDVTDTADPDGEPDTPGPDGDPDHLDPRDYCERTAEAFCDYYLRCGRMVATDRADCLITFAESCEEKYEPTYVALADMGMLALSRAGISQCEDHLETVSCEKQIHDIDGGCSAMWVGLLPPRAPCGIGLESLICDDESECVLNLNFCGECKPIHKGPCSYENRCPEGERCIEGTCVPRGEVGDACSDQQPCLAGLRCEEDTCRGPSFVGLGDACHIQARCPYKSACIEGTCQEQNLLGEPCGPGGCASGYCDGALCQPLLDPGAPCSEHAMCRSQQCAQGHCTTLTTHCITPPPF